MCKKFAFFLLVVSIIFSLGCAFQGNENEQATSSLVFRLPGNSKALPTQNDVASYSVTVKNDSFGYNVTKTGLPGSTMSYTGLIVGTYQVNVEASNASAAVIFVGSSEVEIEYNMSTNVQVQLNYATGDITIGFTFPTEPTAEPTSIPSPTPVSTSVTVEKIGTNHIVTIPISSQNFTVETFYHEEPFNPMFTSTEFSAWTALDASIPDIDPGDTITYHVEFLNPLRVNRNDVPYMAFSIGGMCVNIANLIPSYEYSIVPDGDISFAVGNAGCYTTQGTGNINGLWLNMNTTEEPLTGGAILHGFTASFVIPATLAPDGTSCLSHISCSTAYQSDERSNPLPFVLVE
jgi:hypothetical protein